MSLWDNLTSEEDRRILERGRWAQRAGVGKRPALLLIDCQNYMSGIRGASDNAEAYPLACGDAAFEAIDQMKRLLDSARINAVPVFFTRFIVDPVNDDVGMFNRKIGVGISRGPNLYFAGSHGAQISQELTPRETEIVLDKKKFSGFFATPLLSLLIDRQIDTCVVVGGSTSNCVRATAVDCTQFNFFTIVPREAVFDRLPLAHQQSLSDIDRSYGDVMSVDEVLSYFEELRAANQASRTRESAP